MSDMNMYALNDPVSDRVVFHSRTSNYASGTAPFRNKVADRSTAGADQQGKHYIKSEGIRELAFSYF